MYGQYPTSMVLLLFLRPAKLGVRVDFACFPGYLYAHARVIFFVPLSCRARSLPRRTLVSSFFLVDDGLVSFFFLGTSATSMMVLALAWTQRRGRKAPRRIFCCPSVNGPFLGTRLWPSPSAVGSFYISPVHPMWELMMAIFRLCLDWSFAALSIFSVATELVLADDQV